MGKNTMLFMHKSTERPDEFVGSLGLHLLDCSINISR
jgi:hypothetical protein